MRAEMGKDPTRAPPQQLNLPPGFRFYPTDEELVVHYLCKKAASEPFAVPIIAEVELYKFDPWDLPEKALFGEKEWYFFSPRDRKYPNGSRPNRAAGAGYWKATGTDKPISTMGGTKKVGVKKALVFYEGKAPKGVKTNWIMHEYRLADGGARRSISAKKNSSLRLDDWVLCRIYKKSSSTAAQMKLGADVKTAQSQSSSALDDVLATLSELDDPTHEAPVEAEETHTDMRVCSTEMKSCSDNLYQGGTSHNWSADLRAYMRELHGKAVMEGKGGNKFYAQETKNEIQQHVAAATPESIVSSQQHSPLESYSTSGQQEEEDITGESTFNSIAGLPITQLLNTSSNTHNLAYPPTNSLYGLDMGLPSPCSMLANGGSFGGNLMDLDNFLFQPTHLGWDPTRA